MKDLDLNIYGVLLVGIEGAGKTRLSKVMADHLGWNRLDADEVNEFISGMTLDEARRRRELPVLKERQRALRNAVLNRPKKRLILATTMRPLLDGDYIEKEKVVDAIKNHWIIIHIDNDINSIAKFLNENPAAKLLRNRFDGLNGFQEIFDRLVQMKEELEPLYIQYRNTYVSIASVTDEIAVTRILASVLRFTLPAIIQ